QTEEYTSLIDKINLLRAMFSSRQNEENTFSEFINFQQYLANTLPFTLLSFIKKIEKFFESGTYTLNTPANETKILEASFEKQKKPIPPFILYNNRTLEEILYSENRKTTQLPKAIEKIFEELLKRGCQTQNIFRTCESTSIREIEEVCMTMSVITFDTIPADVLASSFKVFVRNLREHIFGIDETHLILGDWKNIKCEKLKDQDVAFFIRNELFRLEPQNLVFFKKSLKVAYQIILHENVNNMNAKNLSVCLSTNFFTFEAREDENENMEEMSWCIDFFESCITLFPLIFPDEYGMDYNTDFLQLSPRQKTQPKKPNDSRCTPIKLTPEESPNEKKTAKTTEEIKERGKLLLPTKTPEKVTIKMLSCKTGSFGSSTLERMNTTKDNKNGSTPSSPRGEMIGELIAKLKTQQIIGGQLKNFDRIDKAKKQEKGSGKVTERGKEKCIK
ncbi:hypothetical protein EIN_153410, partial [Entamoeba invadens IP1]